MARRRKKDQSLASFNSEVKPAPTSIKQQRGGRTTSPRNGDCIDGVEVELWGECYNIEETTVLDLSGSWEYPGELTGEIPIRIGELVNLTELKLSRNQLTGEIPSEIGNLTNLIELWLSSNQLTGEIPSSIGNLTNLTGLSLWDNQLTGDIPSEIWTLTNLDNLGLSLNQLTGEIPPEIGNLVNLRWLFLGVNQLTGDIPPEIGNLTNLEDLHLYNNHLGCYEYDFEGGCYSFPGSTNQSECCITHCDETDECNGEIPPEIGNLENLDLLWLSENQLTGEIPSSIGDLTNLWFLDLMLNQLTGEIPPEIGNLTNLTYLRLGVNQLSGEIPSEIGNLTNLEDLGLYYNQLSGTIPYSICNLINLPFGDEIAFNIYENQLCPPYPECIPEDNLGYQDTLECDITIDYGLHYGFHLHIGNNLIGIPLYLEDPSVSSVFGSGDNIEGIAGEGVAAFNQDGVWIGSLQEIDPLDGYWVMTTQDMTLSIIGDPIDNPTYNLHLGNNLTSFPGLIPVLIQNAFPDNISSFITAVAGEGVAAFNLNGTWIGSLTELEFGKGYWIITNADISFRFNLATTSSTTQTFQYMNLSLPKMGPDTNINKLVESIRMQVSGAPIPIVGRTPIPKKIPKPKSTVRMQKGGKVNSSKWPERKPNNTGKIQEDKKR